MQPIFRAADESEPGRPGSDEESLRAGTRVALRFLRELLPCLPPAEFEVVDSGEPPALVWTDGKYEEDDPDEPAAVGVVVALPRAARWARAPSAHRDLRRMYTFAHARAAVPPEFMESFKVRQQYIGQVELLGVLCAYTSFGEQLQGKRVLHFVDNTSALAAAARGYAGPTDSRRLVQALHATLAGLRVHAWFDYVRSKANVSGEPSREPELDRREMRPGSGIVSQPARLMLPEARAWGAEAGAWLATAEDVGRWGL